MFKINILTEIVKLLLNARLYLNEESSLLNLTVNNTRFKYLVVNLFPLKHN